MTELTYREGQQGDLRATFELGQRAWDESRVGRGLLPPEFRRDTADLAAQWGRERGLVEFLAAQDDAHYWVCQDGNELVAYVRVSRFGALDELTELWVDPSYGGRGIGRGLLSRCWSGPPTPDLGRLVVTFGRPVDVTLYTGFGVMPVSGHWHMRVRAETYLERRAQEASDTSEPAVHVLKAERAIEEWKRLEPSAIGHDRATLHEFFGRTRTCLAIVDAARSEATALCWVTSEGEIGPAVSETPEGLVPVVLAAMDRVAKMKEPHELGVFCTTDSWWLLDRLRRIGFRVFWPAWIMCSVPLPGLDRYLCTRPPILL